MRTLLQVILAVVASLAPGVAAAGWEKLPPMPEPNGGFACGVLGGKIVVIGGTNWKNDAKQWLDRVWQYDPAARRWTVRQPLPHPLAYAVFAPWRTDLVIAGGNDGVKARAEIWRLTPALALQAAGRLGDGVSIATGGIAGDSLLVIGGCPDPAKLDEMRRGGQRIQLAGGKLDPIAPAGDAPFGIGASAVSGGRLFIFGGAAPDPVAVVRNLERAWAYDPAASKWRALRPLPVAVRGAAAVTLDDRRIYVAGGYGEESEGFRAEGWIYDTSTDSYAGASPLPYAASVALLKLDDFIYCLGGEDRKKHRTDEVFRISAGQLSGGGGRDARKP